MGIEEVLRQTHEYRDGRSARAEGIRRGHNPYASGEKKGSSTAWWLGWDDEDADRASTESGRPMLDQAHFQMKMTLLEHKLNMLWITSYQWITHGPDEELRKTIERTLHEANELHAEMFPDFEHSLYGDDFLSMIDNE